MSVYILVAFLVPLFFALVDIIESHLSNAKFRKTSTMVFYVSMMNMAFIPFIFIFGLPSIPPSSTWILFIFLGIIDVLYLFPQYKAIRVIDTSIAYALSALGYTFLPILSLLVLGDKFTLPQYMGFFAIVGASIFLSVDGKKRRNKKNKRSIVVNKAFYYVFFASLLRGAIYVVIQKKILLTDDNWINVALYTNIISFVIPMCFLFKKKWRKDIVKNWPTYKQNLKPFVINEFFSFLALVCEVFSLTKIYPIFSRAIESTKPIFILFLSYVLYKLFDVKLYESMSKKAIRKKLVCFLIMLLGITMLLGS